MMGPPDCPWGAWLQCQPEQWVLGATVVVLIVMGAVALLVIDLATSLRGWLVRMRLRR
jgi:hypothetical protein